MSPKTEESGLQYTYIPDEIQCGWNRESQRIAQEEVEEARIHWSVQSLDYLFHSSSIPERVKKPLEVCRFTGASTSAIIRNMSSPSSGS